VVVVKYLNQEKIDSMNASKIGKPGSSVAPSLVTRAENTIGASKGSPFAGTTITDVSSGNGPHDLTRGSSTNSLSELSFSEAFKTPGSSSTNSLPHSVSSSSSIGSSSSSSIASEASNHSTHNPESSEGDDYDHYVDPATGGAVNPGSERPHDPWAKKNNTGQ